MAIWFRSAEPLRTKVCYLKATLRKCFVAFFLGMKDYLYDEYQKNSSEACPNGRF
jgi:hypothetical protein